MSRGRQSIERGDVAARKWWDHVDIGNADGSGRGLIKNVNADGVRDVHWYWFGSERGITGIVTSKVYAKPAEALFHELRPDEWDERPKHSRLYNFCGDDDCINPWHWRFSHRGGVQLDTAGKARALTEDDLTERLADVEMIRAYQLYSFLVENWELVPLAFSYDSLTHVQLNFDYTKRMVDKYHEKAFPLTSLDLNELVMGLVEKWLDAERLMTLQEAKGRSDEIGLRRAAKREVLKASLAEKMGDARERSGLSSGAAIRPRPRRRPNST